MTKNKGKKILFLDRDGVINKKAAEHEYVTRVEDFIFNEGIFQILENYKKNGYEFIVITNQRGVARGKLKESDLSNIHSHMISVLQSKNIEVLDIFYCPHENGACSCRKPSPGMIVMALDKYNINIKESALISDSLEDIRMGRDVGIGKNILLKTDSLEILNY